MCLNIYVKECKVVVLLSKESKHSYLFLQCFFLHVPGPRVSRGGPQDGDDQRGWAHCSGAKHLFHLQPPSLCAALSVPMPVLELSQVRALSQLFTHLHIVTKPASVS